LEANIKSCRTDGQPLPACLLFTDSFFGSSLDGSHAIDV
jgi:hypothetical protein